MQQATLAYTYRHNRARGMRAADALQRARQMMAEGKGKTYALANPNPYNRSFAAHGYNALRWIESTDKAGLRFVDYADQILSLNHRGWFADAFQDETYRGAVYQLPARQGRPCLVYGYADPCNEGAALICFDPEWGEAGEEANSRYSDVAREAARMADSMAERFAEKQREYSEAWQQAREWEELRESMKAERQAARALVGEIRQAIKAGQVATGAICQALRDRLATYAAEWEELRQRRDELADNFHFWCDGRSMSIADFAAQS